MILNDDDYDFNYIERISTNCFLLTAKCQPNPCINGTCVAIGSSSFKCQCRVGYTGSLCQAGMITIQFIDNQTNQN